MAKKHSVFLKEDECEGCTNCVKNCPTKAIRVHQGKATIKEDLCIDCAECIRTCEYHAKYTETNLIGEIGKYYYPVALVPPSFYGQFESSIKPLKIVAALHDIGFKEVKDVALAAEAISKKTVNFLNKNSGQYISSSCPVIVRLIKIMYPELLGSLIPLKSPVELMAEKARKDIIKKKNLKKEEIGIFLITPCPAKFTTINNPLGMDESFLNGAIAVDKIYEKIREKVDNISIESEKFKNYNTPYLGIGWGQSGGEKNVLNNLSQIETLSINGISRVKSVLEEISRNNIKGVKYFELTSCPEGCVGGILNVKNSYQAKYNIQKKLEAQKPEISKQNYKFNFDLSGKFLPAEVGKLDDNITTAMEKLEQLEKEQEILPGLDCASCGAPDCETLAEDIVNGKASRTDCIFMLRKEIKDLADRISSLTHELPPVMSENSTYVSDKEKEKREQIFKNKEVDKN
ncbi:MAG: [Fe-Fe] hydrogenase large subunit C-terminal domain-containing protein [Halanaerobiales bacterium]